MNVTIHVITISDISEISMVPFPCQFHFNNLLIHSGIMHQSYTNKILYSYGKTLIKIINEANSDSLQQWLKKNLKLRHSDCHIFKFITTAKSIMCDKN